MIIFDTDWPPIPADLSIKAVLGFETPKQLQEECGHPPITGYDWVEAGIQWFGKTIEAQSYASEQYLQHFGQRGLLDLIPHQGYSVHEITKEGAESLYEIRGIMELVSVSIAIRKLISEKPEILEEKKRL